MGVKHECLASAISGRFSFIVGTAGFMTFLLQRKSSHDDLTLKALGRVQVEGEKVGPIQSRGSCDIGEPFL